MQAIMRLIRSRAKDWLIVALLALATLLAVYQIPYAYSVDLGDAYDWLFVSGFHESESDPNLNFRWSSADSRIVFPAVVQNQNYRLSLRLAAGPRPETASPPEVTLYVNDEAVTSFEAQPEITTYTVKVESAIVTRDPNLRLQISVPTFNPSKSIAGSADNRNLGVIVDRVQLQPSGLPAGLIALPPLGQLLGWAVAAWLWFELFIKTGWAHTPQVSLGALLGGELMLATGFALARPWLAASVWYACAVLAVGWVSAPPLARWIAELRATRSIPFGFLHTLGIRNARARAVVESAAVALIAIYFFVNVVLPLRDAPLGDFATYYATSGIWLQGGNFYDADQLQKFNASHAVLNGKIGPLSYPPSSVVLFAPITLLPIGQAKAVWLLFSFSLLIGAGVLLLLALRTSSAVPASPVWLALMLAYSQSLRHSLEFGQVGPLFFFLFALGLWSWTNRRSALTGVSVVLATAFKLFPAIFLGYFLWKRAWRTLVATVALGAALAVATLVVTGRELWIEYLTGVLPDSSFHRPSNFDQSLLVFLRRINSIGGWLYDNNQLDKTPSLELRAVMLVISMALLALTFWIFYRFASRDALQPELEFAAVLTLMLLILPRMWEHYLMWLILPLYLILNALANRQIPWFAQIGVVVLFALSVPLSQDAPGFFTQPNFPPALVSLGLFATVLVYLSLLYFLSRAPKEETVGSAGVETVAAREPLALAGRSK
jgi:hypothetical protein